jgi:hypothetical protein
MNADHDTIYTLVNGNLDAENIAAGGVATSQILDGTILDADVNAAAAVAPSKVDAWGDDDTNQVVIQDPGTTGALTNATDLTDEIEQLRYAIKRAGMGLSIANATATWVDLPIVGPNLVRHSSFEGTDGDGDSGALVAPTSWTNSNVTVAYATSDITDGNGLAVVVTDTGLALGALTQAINGLKISTKYLLIARVKATSGDTCELVTSGADTDIATTEVSTSSTSMTTLAGVFTTAAGALDDVTIKITSQNANDVCTWDHVGVYELGEDPIPKPSSSATWGAGDCDGIITLAVDVPQPGSIVYLRARATLDQNTIGNSCFARIHDGTNTLDVGYFVDRVGGADAPINLGAVVIDQLPGTSVTYSLDAIEGGGSCDLTSVLRRTTSSKPWWWRHDPSRQAG